MAVPTDQEIERLGSTAKPFFSAKFSAGKVVLQGLGNCTLGKKVPRTTGDLDDGIFLDWHWDGCRLVVRNDRFGLYPLFYSCVGSEVWVSPSIVEVLRGNSKRQLNLPALAVFYRLGHFVGEDTPFTDVHFLPPNSILTWQDGKSILEAGPNASDQTISSDLSFNDAVDKYVHLFAQSVARRLPADEDFTVPISGGRDSRHILFELVKQGYTPKVCPTVKYRPPATNEDTRIARLITGKFGIEHVELDKPASFFQAVLKDVHLTNYCGGGHGWILPVAAKLNNKVSTMYDGLAGSVLSGGFMLAGAKFELFRAQKLEELAELILRENRLEDANKHVLAKALYDSMPMDLAIERLVTELRKHVSARNPMLSFNFWNRTRRCVATIPFAILSDVPVVHCPYLDHELFDFLVSVDESMMAGNRLHDETIRRAYPQHADIPFEDATLKATFTNFDRTYYRTSRKEFASYLMRRGWSGLDAVRPQYLFPKLLLEWSQNVAASPWYMRTALHAIEVDALRRVGQD